jgi:hypothetical protein
MTISSSAGRTVKVARRRLVVGLLGTLVGAVSLTVAPTASAAPAVVNVTVECPQPLSVTADVGDTIVFTFASSCNFDPGVNEWNIWNLEGVSNNPTNAGFLSFVSTTARFVNATTDSCTGSFENCYLPFNVTGRLAQDDWSVTSNLTDGTSVTTILSAINGSNQAIGPGVALGVLSNDITGVSPPWSVAILWAGPRTSGADSEPDMTLWHQSISRSSSDAACPSGYAASWAQWPNDHKGGWVCNRELFAYQPNPGA